MMMILGNVDINDNHWDQIFRILNHEPKEKPSFIDLLKMNIIENRYKIEEISNKASGETLISY